MPVQAATRVNRSTGNGVTTVFPYTFKLISQSHIRVTVDGVVKTITTDYTVSGVGDAGGGNVTFTSAPANLAAVVLSGSAPYSRSTDYVRNGSFQEETVDNDFDLAVILMQQLDERQGRAIAIPIDDATGTDVELPVAADRASKYLAFDVSGNPVATAGTTSAYVVTPFAETLLDDVDASAARTTLGVAIGTNVQAYDADIPTVAASQGEMEAGTEVALRSMSPLRVAQAIAALAPVATGTLTAGTPLVKNPYAASSTTTQAHGLSSAPILFKTELECLSADGNYSVGDKIQVGAGHTGDIAETPAYAGFSVLSDATNVTLITGSTVPYIINKTGYSSFQMTAANWKLTVTPYSLT